MDFSRCVSLCSILLLLLSCLLHLHDNASAESTKPNATAAEKVRKAVLAGYHSLERAKSVPVNLSLIVSRISVDYKESLFLVNGWLITQWNDTKINWNPDQYGGLSEVHMAPYEIWRPDIVAYDSAPGYYSSYDNTNCVINSNGKVVWMPQVTYKVYCKLDISQWPFDTQNCALNLMPESRNDKDMKLTSFVSATIQKKTVSDWKVLETSFKPTSSAWGSEEYSSVNYNFKIQKKHMLYHNFVTLPAAGLLALLLSSFWLLPEEMERIILTGLITIMSALFLVFFSVKVPLLLYETPNIIKYYGCLSFLSLFYMTLTVILYNLSTRPTLINLKPTDSSTKVLNVCSRIVFFASFKRINPIIYDDLQDNSILEDTEAEDDLAAGEPKSSSGTSKSKKRHHGRLIAAIIDYLCFMAYTLIGVIAFFVWV